MEMDNEWHQRGQFEVRKAKDQLKRILLVYVYEYSRMWGVKTSDNEIYSKFET